MHARTPLQTQLRVGGTWCTPERGGHRWWVPAAHPRDDFAKTHHSHGVFSIKKSKQTTSATSPSIESIGLLQGDVESAIDEAIVRAGPGSVITETDLGQTISDLLKTLGKSDDVRVVKYKVGLSFSVFIFYDLNNLKNVAWTFWTKINAGKGP